ncbi:MAG: hypothetical protein OXQ96_06250 [Alphaproteobacteria bacterium]|nr:hypothetical protein [Alphaproteobacteria bacterium]
MSEDFVISDKSQLIQRLTTLNTEPETSFALVFINTTPEEEDIPVIREAVKLCDRVIVAGMGGARQPVEKFLRELGVDVFFIPQKDNRLCKIEAGVKEIDATLILQSILTIWPNVVVTGKHQFKLLRVLKNLQQTFGEIVALREVKQ